MTTTPQSGILYKTITPQGTTPMQILLPIAVIIALHAYRTFVLKYPPHNFWYLPYVVVLWLIVGLIYVPVTFAATVAEAGIIAPIVTTVVLALQYIFIGGAIAKAKPKPAEVLAGGLEIARKGWVLLLPATIVLIALEVWTSIAGGVWLDVNNIIRGAVLLATVLIIIKLKNKD